MAFTVNYPKNNLLLKLLFILLAIIVIPFALFFSLIRIPFANRRIAKLSERLRDDWLPRKKYIYIGFNSGFALSDFIKEKIISQYGESIVWDEWDDERGEWNESEPDSWGRVTTFWQDIGEEFDGIPMIIIATYKPDDFRVSKHSNFYQFWLDQAGVTYRGEEIKSEEAEKKIGVIINSALDTWS
jgi:hypothetical protein